jgi:hypothetical protein
VTNLAKFKRYTAQNGTLILQNYMLNLIFKIWGPAIKFSGHIDVKFPSIVSKLDSFLLFAKIKGEVALALLAAPSYVHVLENAYWCRFEINAKLPLLFNYSIIYYM